MSSKSNHIKRSHRSEYRARPYHTGARQAIGAPTVSKRSFMQFIKMIRGAMRRQPKTTKDAEA